MAQPECARSAGRMAQGLRSGENPARWRGHLDQLLGAPHNGQGGQFTTFIVFVPRRRDISVRGMPSCRVSAVSRTNMKRGIAVLASLSALVTVGYFTVANGLSAPRR